MKHSQFDNYPIKSVAGYFDTTGAYATPVTLVAAKAGYKVIVEDVTVSCDGSPLVSGVFQIQDSDGSTVYGQAYVAAGFGAYIGGPITCGRSGGCFIGHPDVQAGSYKYYTVTYREVPNNV